MRLLAMLNNVLKRKVSNSTDSTFVSEKNINKRHHNIRQRLLNLKSSLEEATNYRAWRHKLLARLVDWTATCLLFILSVVCVASENRILLAIGLFVITELFIEYFKTVVRIIKQTR